MDDAQLAARAALQEDLAGYGDLTGRVIEGKGSASVMARGGGLLSGSEPFAAVARLVDPDVVVAFHLPDGGRFDAGDVLATLKGDVSSLLALERTGLNFLGRLSGVASMTAAFVAETAGTKARIAATRKTTPGLRALEKRAVEHGGGLPHRFGLFDAAMVKDNHIRAAGGITAAVAAVRSWLGHVHTITVEVDSLDQIDEALACGVHVVLLDNMDVETVRAGVRQIAGRAIVEVSGGVTLDCVRPLAEAGVDVISVGALTTRSTWVDIAMDME